MAVWTTPVTDWDGVTVGRKYYNFGDIDRVEQNTEYLKDELVTLGYVPATTTFVYGSRTNKSFLYYDDLNRIENNIKALKDAFYEPLDPPWETPYTTWTSASKAFTFNDANRLEKNLLGIYEMLEDITEAYLYCGDSQATICGKGNTVF